MVFLILWDQQLLDYRNNCTIKPPTRYLNQKYSLKWEKLLNSTMFNFVTYGSGIEIAKNILNDYEVVLIYIMQKLLIPFA